MAWKMHEVNKVHMPKMENGDPIGDIMMNQWKTERETRMEQETTPTKKRRLERLVVDEVDESMRVPDNYRQDTSVVENSCVWLAACLLIRSVDIKVAEIMNQKYRDNPAIFEWLPFFKQNDTPLQNSLYDMMKNLEGCPYFVTRLRIPLPACGDNIAKYLIQKKDTVLLLVQLEDTVGNNSHVVGINVAKRLIYDCQENSALPLSLDNLSRCCGVNRTFARFYHYCEICRNNHKKMHV